MLVLRRKVGQAIIVDDRIRITISRIQGNRVCLGIEAPPDVRILRGELKPHDSPAGTTTPTAVLDLDLHTDPLAGDLPDPTP